MRTLPLLLLAACDPIVVDALDPGEARLLCVRETTPGLAHGGAFSLPFPDRTLWVLGPTTEGEAVASNAALVGPRGDDPCADDPVPLRDGDGALAELLPGEGEGVYWPLSGVVRGDEGLLLARKVIVRGFWDLEVLGTVAARLGSDGTATLLTPGHLDDPTLLWGPEAPWGTATVLDQGLVVTWGCFQRGDWDHACTVARVPFDEVDVPGAWRYRTDGGWSTAPEDAVPMVLGAASLALTRAPSGDWLGAVLPPLSNTVYAEWADGPAGPLDTRMPLFDGDAPTDAWSITDLFAHPEYATEDEVVFSYRTDPVDGPAGVRFVAVGRSSW